MNISKVIKRIKIGEKKVVIIFDDGSKLEIRPNVYTEFNFFKGKAMSKKDINEVEEVNQIDEFVSYATKLCASKSYTKSKIKEKLIKKGANEAQCEKVIDVLIKYQLLDEKAFIKEYLEYADYRKYGYNRIKDELYKKGLSSYQINNVKYDEKRDLTLARELVKPYEKKYNKYSYSAMKSHIYTALLRQGYTYDVASKALEEVSPIDLKKEKELLKIEYQKAKRKYENKYGDKTSKEKIIQYLLAKGFMYKDIISLKEE